MTSSRPQYDVTVRSSDDRHHFLLFIIKDIGMLSYISTEQKSIALKVNVARSIRSNKVSVQVMWIIIKFFHGRLIREIFFIKLFKKKIRSNCIFTPVMTQIENFLILSSHYQSFQVYRDLKIWIFRKYGRIPEEVVPQHFDTLEHDADWNLVTISMTIFWVVARSNR